MQTTMNKLPSDGAIRCAIELSGVNRSVMGVKIFASENPELIAFARYIEQNHNEGVGG